MGKITINLECNSIEEAKALLDFLSGYRKEQKKEEIDTAMTALKEASGNPVEVEGKKITAEDVNHFTKEVLKEVSENPVSEPPKPVTAEDISRFAVSLLRQGKGAEIKNLLAAYDAKSFTDIPKDKRALFLSALERI